MIDWLAIRAALLQIAVYGMGLDQVVFADEERPFTEKQWGSIDLARVMQLGSNDYVRYDNSDPSPSATPYILGMRKIYILFAVESINQGLGPDDNAQGPIERFRTLMSLPLVGDILDAAGLSQVDNSDSTPADYELDGRVISRMEMTVDFNLAVNYHVGDPMSAQSWIQSVGLTSQIVRPDGVVLFRKVNELVGPVPAPP